MESFFKSLHPLDTTIPDKRDFIFIKETWQNKWGSVSRGGGGGVIYTTFSTWGRGMKVTRNYYYIFTFDLFTLSNNVLQTKQRFHVFSSIFSWKLRIIPYLCEIDVCWGHKYQIVCLVQFCHSLFDQQAFCEIRKLWVMENYPAVNIFCELWPFGTYDPDRRTHLYLLLVS